MITNIGHRIQAKGNRIYGLYKNQKVIEINGKKVFTNELPTDIAEASEIIKCYSSAVKLYEHKQIQKEIERY